MSKSRSINSKLIRPPLAKERGGDRSVSFKSLVRRVDTNASTVPQPVSSSDLSGKLAESVADRMRLIRRVRELEQTIADGRVEAQKLKQDRERAVKEKEHVEANAVIQRIVLNRQLDEARKDKNVNVLEWSSKFQELSNLIHRESGWGEQHLAAIREMLLGLGERAMLETIIQNNGRRAGRDNVEEWMNRLQAVYGLRMIVTPLHPGSSHRDAELSSLTKRASRIVEGEVKEPSVDVDKKEEEDSVRALGDYVNEIEDLHGKLLPIVNDKDEPGSDRVLVAAALGRLVTISTRLGVIKKEFVEERKSVEGLETKIKQLEEDVKEFENDNKQCNAEHNKCKRSLARSNVESKGFQTQLQHCQTELLLARRNTYGGGGSTFEAPRQLARTPINFPTASAASPAPAGLRRRRHPMPNPGKGRLNK